MAGCINAEESNAAIASINIALTAFEAAILPEKEHFATFYSLQKKLRKVCSVCVNHFQERSRMMEKLNELHLIYLEAQLVPPIIAAEVLEPQQPDWTREDIFEICDDNPKITYQCTLWPCKNKYTRGKALNKHFRVKHEKNRTESPHLFVEDHYVSWRCLKCNKRVDERGRKKHFEQCINA